VGLPVLTCAGTTLVGRVCASLLHAVALPEMITGSLDAYEALALKLATDADSLAAIKEKLVRNRGSQPLFDTDRFRRHFEAAFVTMHEKHQRGDQPASFSVEPLP
jgi:protein O-GlcNAc transferase